MPGQRSFGDQWTIWTSQWCILSIGPLFTGDGWWCLGSICSLRRSRTRWHPRFDATKSFRCGQIRTGTTTSTRFTRLFMEELLFKGSTYSLIRMRMNESGLLCLCACVCVTVALYRTPVLRRNICFSSMSYVPYEKNRSIGVFLH